MRLINKDEVVAKIERLQDATVDENANFYSAKAEAKYNVLCELDCFLDTLETKEVDLDNELDFVKDAYYYFTSDERSSMKKVARHFFELGLSAQTSTVWHYVSEEIPTKFGKPVIVASLNKNKEDGIWLYDLIQSWEGEWSPRVNWENPVKWAYMDDLLK